MCAPQSLHVEKSIENQNTPVFFAHGQQDEVVPLFLGNSAFQMMKENGYNVEWKEYMMQHNVCLPEIAWIFPHLFKQNSLKEHNRWVI